MKHNLEEKRFNDIAPRLKDLLERRQFEAHVVQTKDEARDLVFDLIKDAKSVSFGGSATVDELGFKEDLRWGQHNVLTRETPEKTRQSIIANYYLMSTNAITTRGELVNVDGLGNRVAALTFAAENVVVIVGRNKIVSSIEAGLDRIATYVAPLNVGRLGLELPACAKTGTCANCVTPQTVCATKVITRMSKIPGRIKVVLVNEELGF
ncbi:MAG: lactate utilization protein [Lactobacillales bacterium]|jgi:hypothetical protein|nr:lactate utilization protein [Lactobacillales bacterium]